jgi:hypothetical protein
VSGSTQERSKIVNEESREIHIHLNIQPGASATITVAGDGITVAGGHAVADGGTPTDDDRLEAAIQRLEDSGVSRNIRAVVDGLRGMGYTLKLPETKVAGKQSENYLRIVDPGQAGRHGVGYLTPSYVGFARASDRERLLGLDGARPVTSAVNFDHAESAQPALEAARLLKS